MVGKPPPGWTLSCAQAPPQVDSDQHPNLPPAPPAPRYLHSGWAFDAEGRLRDVPSAEAGRWPKRPLVSSYPVVESGGFVWMFFGDLPEDLRPPLPTAFMPELDDPKWHAGDTQQGALDPHATWVAQRTLCQRAMESASCHPRRTLTHSAASGRGLTRLSPSLRLPACSVRRD